MNRKKTQLRSYDGIFWQISVKSTKFQDLISNFMTQVSAPVSEFLMKSPSPGFNQVSKSYSLEGYSLDYVAGKYCTTLAI